MNSPMRAADLPAAKTLGKRFLAVLRSGAGRRTAVETGSGGWLPVADLLQECRVSFAEFCAAVEQGGRRFQLREVNGQREIRSTPKTCQGAVASWDELHRSLAESVPIKDESAPDSVHEQEEREAEPIEEYMDAEPQGGDDDGEESAAPAYEEASASARIKILMKVDCPNCAYHWYDPQS